MAGGDTLKDFFLNWKEKDKDKKERKEKEKEKAQCFLHKRRGGLRERPFHFCQCQALWGMPSLVHA